VREYKYLGYKLQRNGGQESHVKERVAKAAAIMGHKGNWKEEIWKGLEKKDVDVR